MICNKNIIKWISSFKEIEIVFLKERNVFSETENNILNFNDFIHKKLLYDIPLYSNINEIYLNREENDTKLCNAFSFADICKGCCFKIVVLKLATHFLVTVSLTAEICSVRILFCHFNMKRFTQNNAGNLCKTSSNYCENNFMRE